MTREADTGATLVQRLPDGRGWSMHFQAVRLWELDAAAAVQDGPPGLVALAPLMAGITADLVEQAALRLEQEVAPGEQSDLFTVLGLLAEGLIGKDRVRQMVTREQVFESEFLREIFEEELKVREGAAIAEERARMQQMVGEALLSRFPDAPARLLTLLPRVLNSDDLLALFRAILTAPDLAAVEQAIAAHIG